MKTFKDLDFKPWVLDYCDKIGIPFGELPRAFGLYHNDDYIARMNFENGYGVSVLCGKNYYSNGVDTYEVAILKDDKICYDTPITDDVIGYCTFREVSDIMKRVQML